MYLSKFLIVEESHRTLPMLTNAQEMHKDIQRLFEYSRAEQHVLYRVYDAKQAIYVYVQSDIPPRVNEQYCPHLKLLNCTEMTKAYASVVARGKFQFNITCAPTVSKHRPGKRSIRKFLQKSEDRIDWFRRKLEEGGCEVDFCEDRVDEGIFLKRQGTPFMLGCATIEGVATIRDPDKFMEMLRAGVGPEKAYGCGLLMIA